ncbi:DUF4097 family beta strand repeat-containing protein [Deinococcus sp.]|uniref:DUF4097 family beta strand repeat-containing protein n=1 Tax=Deinococcus sp. TaxID=47478 RepID=UPI0025E8148A|nr:DUF4097 family beta strand repeat-containing protein [Deinococcus sp.]
MNYKVSVLLLSAALLGTSLAAPGTSTTTRQFPAAQVSTLRIGVDFHDIEVEVVLGERVSVVTDTKVLGIVISPGTLIPVVSLSGGVLSIRSPSHVSINIGSLSGHVRVRLPPGKTLDLVTDSGNITVAVPARSMTLQSDSGTIQVKGGAPHLTLRTDSGNIQVQSGGAVVARSDSGNLNLAGLSGLLTARSDSGNITASWTKAPAAGKVAVQSGSGDVQLSLPRGASYGGSLRSESGRVTVQRPGSQSRGEGQVQLGDAPLMLNVSSDSGDVTVHQP